MNNPLYSFTRSRIAPLAWSMICLYFGIIIWFGALLMFGYGVAPVIFTIVPSRDLAGLVNTEILSRLQILEHTAVIFIIIGVLIFSFRSRLFLRSRWLLISIICALLLAGLLFWYAHVLTPSMTDLRTAITSFDRPSLSDEPLLAAFRNAHRIYSGLVGCQMMILLLLFFWQTALFMYALLYDDAPKKPESLESLSR